MSDREILVHTPSLAALPDTLRAQLRRLCARTGRRVRAAGRLEMGPIWENTAITHRVVPSEWPVDAPLLVFSPRFGDPRDFGKQLHGQMKHV